MGDFPHAIFRHQPDGTGASAAEIVKMTKEQFVQSVRAGRICRCGRCVCCRAAEYLRESKLERIQ